MTVREQNTEGHLAPPRPASLPHEVMALLPDQWPAELPLARVTTCGPSLSMTVLHQLTPTPVYGPPDPAVMAGGYASTAQLLLAVLASRPHGAASKDWLSEALITRRSVLAKKDDLEERTPLQRVENPVSVLRHLLVPPVLRTLPTLAKLRLHLVSFYRSTRESGCGYRLAGMPLIWVDVVAIEESITRAHALEQFGSDAQREWEAAYTLLMQGAFVEREPYSDWAVWRRQEQERQRWECVHALQGYYRKQGEPGEREATRILQRYWQSHMSNEDAFRPLVELLGKQEWYGQAEEAYTHLTQALEEEGKEPDRRTQEVMVWLRALQIQRRPSPEQSVLTGSEMEQISLEPSLSSNGTTQATISKKSVSSSSQDVSQSEVENTSSFAAPSTQASVQQQTPLSSFASTITQDIIGTKQELFFPSESGIFIPGRMLTQMALGDSAVWFGGLIAQIIIMVSQWNKDVLSCADLQQVLDQEIVVSMKPEPANEAYMLSRRQALITLATLPLSLLMSTRKRPTQAFPLEDFLPQCAASLTACWHLLQGNQLTVVEEVLPAYLSTLLHYAQQPSHSQKVAANLSSQSYLLRGLLAHHQMQFMARQLYCQEAIRLSIIAEDDNLQVAGLMHLGNTFYYSKEAEKALHTFQEALSLIKKVSPLLQSCIHMRLAMASARCNQSFDDIQPHISVAHQEFPEHPEHDPSFLYAEYGRANLHLIEGLAYLDLGEYHGNDEYYERAWSTFSHIKVLQPTSTVPERNRIQIINYQAKTAAVLGDQERFCTYLKIGVDGSRALGSQKRRQEALDIYWQGRKLWPHDTQVRALADLFVQ